MGRQHKYFRKKRYKQKLENMVHECDTNFSRAYFLTKNPDPRHERKTQGNRFYYGEEKVPGRNYYRYWERPEVEYTILEYTSPRRSKCNKFLKKKANKKIRQCEDFYNHNLYKKQYDIKWSLD